jgi:hypothetical protein
MLKAIADLYKHGSMSAFRKVKVFSSMEQVKKKGQYYSLLHLLTSITIKYKLDNHVRLWSIKYIPEAEIYDLWLEQTLSIEGRFEDRMEFIPCLVKFYWNLKVNVLIFFGEQKTKWKMVLRVSFIFDSVL